MDLCHQITKEGQYISVRLDFIYIYMYVFFPSSLFYHDTQITESFKPFFFFF